MPSFSDFIVYVDESGDHGLATINREFPLFVLTFCIFRKDDYLARVVPSLQRLKFQTFGHDMVVLHEREIRKAEGPFTFLIDASRRGAFMTDLNAFVEGAPMAILAVVIRKDALRKRKEEIAADRAIRDEPESTEPGLRYHPEEAGHRDGPRGGVWPKRLPGKRMTSRIPPRSCAGRDSPAHLL